MRLAGSSGGIRPESSLRRSDGSEVGSQQEGPAGQTGGALVSRLAYDAGSNGGTLKLPLDRTPLMSVVFIAYWSVA
jgi:hypothetical protein